MIKYLRNQEIDRLKWDQRVFKSGNARMYALAGYLDAITNSWDALVVDNYQVILPLPINRKLILKRSIIPPFVQQLGVIGSNDPSLISEMIQEAAKKFWKFHHHLNHENGQIIIEGFHSMSRNNFELNLNGSYEDINKGYDQHLKRNLDKAKSNGLIIEQSKDIMMLKRFVKLYSNPGDPTGKHFGKIEAIFNYSTDLFIPEMFVVKNDDELLAVALVPKFLNRRTLLIPRSSPEGRKTNAMAFLIDQLIQSNAGSNAILDFEGSMIAGVARFYKQFGAVNKLYRSISN